MVEFVLRLNTVNVEIHLVVAVPYRVLK